MIMCWWAEEAIAPSVEARYSADDQVQNRFETDVSSGDDANAAGDLKSYTFTTLLRLYLRVFGRFRCV